MTLVLYIKIILEGEKTQVKEEYHKICISVCTEVYYDTKISEINFMRQILLCVPSLRLAHLPYVFGSKCYKILKTTLSRCLLAPGKMHAFFGCTKLTDTCTLHQRKYQSVILITIKVLNIGTDRSDPDQTAPNYEQSDHSLYCFVIPPASVYAFTAIKKGDV